MNLSCWAFAMTFFPTTLPYAPAPMVVITPPAAKSLMAKGPEELFSAAETCYSCRARLSPFVALRGPRPANVPWSQESLNVGPPEEWPLP